LNILPTAHASAESAMIVIERIADQPAASDNGAMEIPREADQDGQCQATSQDGPLAT
jgi:hypothetical protein